MKKEFTVVALLTFLVAACENKGNEIYSYPLFSLFEASKTLDGEVIQVTGYFGYWDGDIPVLFATYSDYERLDGLYKSHLIFNQEYKGKKVDKNLQGKVCTFKANIWYKYHAPTLDNATLVHCK